MEETKKIPFFKRVVSSISNFESYSKFALENFSVAVKYIAKLLLIFSIIMAIVFSYKFSCIINNEEELQILRNQLQEVNGIDINTIEDSIQYIKSNSNFNFYCTLALSFCVYFFCAMFLYSFIDAAIVSIVGFLTSRLTKMRLKYKAIYIMSMYALTLPIILNCIYGVVNTLTGFTISYFQIVYNVIAYIYIVTAVLMIKTDFIEQQRELIKIVQEQRKVKYEQKRENEDIPEEEQNKKEEPNGERKDGNSSDEEPDSEPET